MGAQDIFEGLRKGWGVIKDEAPKFLQDFVPERTLQVDDPSWSHPSESVMMEGDKRPLAAPKVTIDNPLHPSQAGKTARFVAKAAKDMVVPETLGDAAFDAAANVALGGPLSKPIAYAGKEIVKKIAPAVLGAAGAASASDAEAASVQGRAVFDMLRKAGGMNPRFRQMVDAYRVGLPTAADKTDVTKHLNALDQFPELVLRELTQNPDDIFHRPFINKAERRIMSPREMFREGDVVVPLVWDTTRAGEEVTHIGRKLDTPVKQYGGPDYPLVEPSGAAGASELAAARSKNNNFKKAEYETRGDGRVLGVHVAMAPEGSWFARHPTETFMEAMRSAQPDVKLRGSTLEQLDSVIRKQLEMAIASAEKSNQRAGSTNKAAQAREALAKYPGIASSEIDEFLANNSEARRALMRAGNSWEMQKQGVPDMDMVKKAYTDPRFNDRPTGSTGGLVIDAKHDHTIVRDKNGWHPTYDTRLKGDYVGELEHPVGYADLWPDSAMMENPMRSLMMRHWMQRLDGRTIDALQAQHDAKQEMIRRMRGG